MNKTEQEILHIIQTSSGIKAKDIASRLGLSRNEVNSVLYGSLKTRCYQDSTYRWFAIEQNKQQIAKNQGPAPDKKLSDLCRYYLNCLSLETSSGISAFLTSKYSLSYAEISSIAIDQPVPEVANLIKKVSNDSTLTAHIGYPCLIQKIYSSKTEQYFYKLAPVLLFPVEIEAGSVKIGTIPRINIEVIRQYSEKDINSQVYDLIELENELGLNEAGAEIEIDEMIARLQSLRHWAWKEKLDPNIISIDPPISSLTEEGIYNKAVFIITDKSPYTVGLESELSALSQFTEDDYRDTALYNWIHPEKCVVKEVLQEDTPLLTVLPTNTEQEYAIQSGLKNTLTIVTGPPGTGKSQVVTNLLANIAWNNKNALFTSKNNKAVDVVETRLNNLAKRPIMIRIGGQQYAIYLATIINNLLSSVSDANDFAEYERYKELYQNKLSVYNRLLEQKKNTIGLRNQVDHLEQKFCELRENWKSFFGVIDEKEAENCEKLLIAFHKDYTHWLDIKNSLLGKLCWFIIGNNKTQKLNAIVSTINSYFEKYNIQNQLQITEQSNLETFEHIESTFRELVYVLNTISEYKNALSELATSISVEKIDKDIVGIKRDLSDLAMRLWQKWLASKPLKITPLCRKRMAEYVAATNLLNVQDTTGLSALNKKFKQLQAEMAEFLPCWAVTSLSAKGRIPFRAGIFDLVVIDEASQCDIASVMPMLFRAKRAVIIGDPKQLSHISTISKKQDATLLQKYDIDFTWSYTANSLYALASSLSRPEDIIQLRDHHRSCSDIIEFSNQEFYEGKLRIATDYQKLTLPRNVKMGMRWINIVGKTQRPPSGGAYNDIEAHKIVEEIRHLIVDNAYQGTVGVVTPFRKQADLIKNLIEKDNILDSYLAQNNRFLVDTVHKFQGDERDIMFFSPVISTDTPPGAISFLNNTGNLFNVAITRAKSVLVVVGDEAFCAKCQVPYMEHFVEYLHNNKESAQHVDPDYNLLSQQRNYPEVANPEQVSDWEKLFYTELFDYGIKTIPQYAIDKYKLDLAIILGEHKLDIEIDGEMYHKDWNGELSYRDRLRNQRLYELGWDVKRFWVYQIRDTLPECVSQIKQWVEKYNHVK